jgi:hypothetical protein
MSGLCCPGSDGRQLLLRLPGAADALPAAAGRQGRAHAVRPGRLCRRVQARRGAAGPGSAERCSSSRMTAASQTHGGRHTCQLALQQWQAGTCQVGHAGRCSAGGMAQLGSVKKPAAQAAQGQGQGPAPASPPPKLGAWGKGAPVRSVPSQPLQTHLESSDKQRASIAGPRCRPRLPLMQMKFTLRLLHDIADEALLRVGRHTCVRAGQPPAAARDADGHRQCFCSRWPPPGTSYASVYTLYPDHQITTHTHSIHQHLLSNAVVVCRAPASVLTLVVPQHPHCCQTWRLAADPARLAVPQTVVTARHSAAAVQLLRCVCRPPVTAHWCASRCRCPRQRPAGTAPSRLPRTQSRTRRTRRSSCSTCWTTRTW